jgi:uncharacterized protein (TIGR00730 family)
MKLLSLSFLPQSRRFSEVSANHNVRQFAIPKSESFQKMDQVTFSATPNKTRETASDQEILAEFPRENGVVVYSGYSPLPDDPTCELAKRLGRALGKTFKNGQPLHVVTGGGEKTSNMGATAEGAMEVGSKALGVAIPFPGWIPPEKDHTRFVMYPTFPMRVYGPVGFEQTSAYTVALPGGIGTAWELLAKAQDLWFDHTPLPCQKQIVLVDHNGFYSGPNGLMPYLQGLVDRGMMKKEIMGLFTLVKTPEEVPAKLMDESVKWTTGCPEGAWVVQHKLQSS